MYFTGLAVYRYGPFIDFVYACLCFGTNKIKILEIIFCFLLIFISDELQIILEFCLHRLT